MNGDECRIPEKGEQRKKEGKLGLRKRTERANATVRATRIASLIMSLFSSLPAKVIYDPRSDASDPPNSDLAFLFTAAQDEK